MTSATSSESNDVLGIDCGRVIFYPSGKQVPGALVSLGKIASSGRFKEIYIVSRASIFNRLYFPFRLALLKFWGKTGIPRNHLNFCYRNRDKAALCETLGITHFVDDRLDVLRHLRTVPHRFALDPSMEELEKFPDLAHEVQIVSSWEELVPLLLRT